MLPEVAAAYGLGLIPSAAVTGLQIWSHRRKVSSSKYRQMQSNLQKVNLYWREAHSELSDYLEDREARDLANYEKNLLLMGMGFAALSWLGFVFNLIVFFSIHSWAVSRKERALFDSEIVQREMSAEEVRKAISDLD